MSEAERGLFERIKEQIDYRNEGWWPGEVNRICKEFEQRLAEAEADLILKNTEIKVAQDQLAEAERLIAAKDKGLLAACTAMRLNGMHRVPAYLDAEEAHSLSLTAPQQEPKP